MTPGSSDSGDENLPSSIPYQSTRPHIHGEATASAIYATEDAVALGAPPTKKASINGTNRILA